MVCTDADRSSKLKRMCQNSRRDFLPGVSHLGVKLKTAWVMSHRAVRQGALSALPPMSGAGETVEADETLIGRIEGEKKRPATPS